MDNTRVVIATVLCLGILVGWGFVSDYMGWTTPPAPPVIQESVAPATQSPTAEPVAPAVPLPRFAPSEGREVTVQTPLYTAVFHSAGGILQSFTLNKYKQSIEPDSALVNMVTPAAAAVAPMGLLLNGQASWSVGQWSFDGQDLNLQPGEAGTLTFVGLVDGVRVTRQVTFFADTYLMEEKVALASESDKVRSARLSYTLAASNLGAGGNYDMMRMVWDDDGSFKEDNDVKDLTNEGLLQVGPYLWAGMKSNYFLSAVSPVAEGTLQMKARIQDNIWRMALEKPEIMLEPGASANMAVNWWIGPKERELLAAAPGDLAAANNMGMFTFLALPLLWLLTTFYGLAANWGVAIILLTILIKIVFWPLTRKSYKSMEQMKKIQPMMKELQKKHEGDKEALSREMMQLYKTYGVNPMGGCLPILVQLPVFFALYQALLSSIELRHASFITYLPFTDYLWLADLSVKDPLYITPIIMGATMFLQQWLSPAMGDPMQRKMMMLMPLIFSFMFLSFPAGLVLYWLCNNVLSIAQQWWTLRRA